MSSLGASCTPAAGPPCARHRGRRLVAALARASPAAPPQTGERRLPPRGCARLLVSAMLVNVPLLLRCPTVHANCRRR